MIGELEGVDILPDVFGQDVDAVITAQRGCPEGGTGLIENQPDCAFIDDLCGLKEFRQVRQMHHRPRVLFQQLEGEGDVLRCQWMTIRPLDALAQGHGDDTVVLVVLPRLGEPIFVFARDHIEHDEGLEHRR